MRKIISLLSRMMLMLGVLVALTPCGICHTSIGKAPQACSMPHMTGKMDCCQKGKKTSPLCKAMDQSSTAAVSHGSVAVPALVVVFASTLAATPSKAFAPSSILFDTSPPRVNLALRI